MTAFGLRETEDSLG